MEGMAIIFLCCKLVLLICVGFIGLVVFYLLGIFAIEFIITSILSLAEVIDYIGHKFACIVTGDPHDVVCETYSFWLATISPFHQLWNLRHRRFRGTRDIILSVLLVILELILLPLSLVGGTIITIPALYRELVT